MTLKIKRIYEPPAPDDGLRILVDRVWPRGIKKEEAGVDLWLKEVAPSTALRQWFGHDPARWAEFRRRYRAELQHGDALAELHQRACRKKVTLLFAARDREHNNAVALREFIERRSCEE